jgi:hypothetical protein
MTAGVRTSQQGVSTSGSVRVLPVVVLSVELLAVVMVVLLDDEPVEVDELDVLELLPVLLLLELELLCVLVLDDEPVDVLDDDELLPVLVLLLDDDDDEPVEVEELDVLELLPVLLLELELLLLELLELDELLLLELELDEDELVVSQHFSRTTTTSPSLSAPPKIENAPTMG